MIDTVVYSTDAKENNRNTNNLTMFDYLASECLLQGAELETAEELIKAFRKQKSISSSIDYEKVFVDGGKYDTNIESVIQANRKWSEFESFLKHKASFVEKYLCIEKTIGQYEEELGKVKLMEIISELVLIIEKLTRLRCSDWSLIIMELRKNVYAFGFRKTANKLHIAFSTLKKILNGSKNVNFKSVEKLVNFFGIEKIER